jgi:hypothetical protein
VAERSRTVAAEHAQLTSEFPGRVLLGVGIGHPEATSHYSSPLSTMRSFFDGLDNADVPVPRDQRCMAALGPRMLDLSAQRSLEYAALYLGLRNYTSNLLKFGFTDEDIADGGSDRLIDAIIPHGTATEIATVAREHLHAGADHVCLQPVGVSGVPREQWTALASALDL